MKRSLTVVIPTLNEEHYLPALLQDLILQKDKDFEVIIVDGKSDDHTPQFVMSSKKLLNIKLYSVTRRNVSYQRNFGAKKATSDYIIFLDADSRLEPQFITKVRKRLTSRIKVYVPHILPDRHIIWTKSLFTVLNFLIRSSRYIKKPFSSGGNMIVNRKFFMKVGGFDPRCTQGEDHYFIQTAYKAHGKIMYPKSIRIYVSLRRMEKEKLMLFYKYFIATTHILFKGKIDKTLYEYKMGGDYFD